MADQEQSSVDAQKKDLHLRKPAWLKTPLPSGATYFKIKKDLRERSLYTVCEEAKCPNIGQCWNANIATFMVLGDTCTRACRFCNVKTGNPGGWLDESEPQKTAETAKLMGLKYVVITMVDRDDLADGGAAHVAEVITKVKEINPGIVVEILAGDFRGDREAMGVVLAAKPEVYAHNLETVKRLSPRVRDARATYDNSLAMLNDAKKIAEYPVLTKSALMLGVGEELSEIKETLNDLRGAGVDLLAMGQYLRPTKKHLAIKRMVPPADFQDLELYARAAGFRSVASGPLVRSSFMAHQYFAEATASE